MMPPWITSRVLPGLAIATALALVAYQIDAHGYDRARVKYEARITSLKADYASAQREAEAEAAERRDAQSKNLLKLSESLIAANSTIDAQARQLKERTHDVSTQYRPQPDADLQPVPGWVVTDGWVCDYNRAIGYGLPGAGATAGGAENTSCAADAFVPSGVSAERILRHHEEYGAYCRKLEQQLNVILDHEDFIQGQATR